MKIPSSLRQVLRDLDSASKGTPSWLLLEPSLPVHHCLWTRERDEIIPAFCPDKIPKSIAQIPVGGHLATSRASWVADLAKTLFGPDAKRDDHVILPLHEGSRVVAYVGWSRTNDSTKDIGPSVPELRRTLRRARISEMVQTENRGLHWVLRGSDRFTAAVRPDGEILAMSPPAYDFLKSIPFGPGHYFQTDAPKLPSSLARAVRLATTGQVKLTDTCTARFDLLKPSPSSWLPLIGIEFFVEPVAEGRSVPLPVSRLTAVERQVYELILKTGASNKEIARARKTAVATAKNQVSAILQKLGATHRNQLLIRGGHSASFGQLRSPELNGVTTST